MQESRCPQQHHRRVPQWLLSVWCYVWAFCQGRGHTRMDWWMMHWRRMGRLRDAQEDGASQVTPFLCVCLLDFCSKWSFSFFIITARYSLSVASYPAVVLDFSSGKECLPCAWKAASGLSSATSEDTPEQKGRKKAARGHCESTLPCKRFGSFWTFSLVLLLEEETWLALED